MNLYRMAAMALYMCEIKTPVKWKYGTFKGSLPLKVTSIENEAIDQLNNLVY